MSMPVPTLARRSPRRRPATRRLRSTSRYDRLASWVAAADMGWSPPAAGARRTAPFCSVGGGCCLLLGLVEVVVVLVGEVARPPDASADVEVEGGDQDRADHKGVQQHPEGD